MRNCPEVSRTSGIVFVVVGAMLLQYACARPIDTEAPRDGEEFVVVQFDPTNEIPVLNLIPSPTALAQTLDPATHERTYLLDQAEVVPEPCELPTAAQCLQYTEGWPISAKPTLYFSGEIDTDTIGDGIKMYELDEETNLLVSVPYSFQLGARPDLRQGCREGNNGSDPPKTFQDEDVPPGIQLELAPATEFKEQTTYFLVVLSAEVEGEDAEGLDNRALAALRGLQDGAGQPVEASALFSIMNVGADGEAPVTEDHIIQSALLRSQVYSSVLDRLFSGRSRKELNAEERIEFDAEVSSAAEDLRLLYLFFETAMEGLARPGADNAPVLADHRRAVFANFWMTTPRRPIIEFDPKEGVIPFPNIELLTRETPQGLEVAFPDDPEDSPAARTLKEGLSALSGFSTLAPITLSASQDVDETTLIPGETVFMLELDESGAVVGDADFSVRSTPADVENGTGATIWIEPNQPLPENTDYVVALANRGQTAIRNLAGEAFDAASAYRLLQFEEPFIDDQLAVPESQRTRLECVPVASGDDVAEGADLVEVANQLELPELPDGSAGLSHPRWLRSLNTITTAEGLTADDVLMAFGYRTQDVTGALSTLKADGMESGAWAAAIVQGGDIVGPVASCLDGDDITEMMDIPGNFCVPLCYAGALPSITGTSTAACGTSDMPGPTVADDAFCLAVQDLYTSELEELCPYHLHAFRVIDGNPFVDGNFTATTTATPESEIIPFWVARGAQATGNPAAVYLHGFGRQKEDGLYVANSLAREGWATVMFDLPYHGERTTDIISNSLGIPCVDASTRVPNIDPLTEACDGEIDPSGTGFITPNPLAVRDNFRQTTLDLLTLLNGLKEFDDTVIDMVDGDTVGILGSSLGGIAAAASLPYLDAVEIQGAVLNTAGGGLLQNVILDTIPAITQELFISLRLSGVCDFLDDNDPAAGCKDRSDFRQWSITAQWGLDPGDALATSIGAAESAILDRTLMQTAMPDPVVSSRATEALAQALGILDGDGRRQNYDVSTLSSSTAAGAGCHGFLWDPLQANEQQEPMPCGPCFASAFCQSAVAQTQAAAFLDSAGLTILDAEIPASFAGFDCRCE